VERLREVTAVVCGVVAAIFLVAMMMLTVADVTLRAAFNLPIRGIYEMIELLLTGTFFVALPAAFLRNDNIIVNVIDSYAPRWVPWLSRFALILAIIVLALMAWQGWKAARDAIDFNDMTADLGVPRIWHWSALLVGVIGAGLAAVFMALRGNDRR
jgi:TRAP-type C4-dicarboxylate transport system permease small subunit